MIKKVKKKTKLRKKKYNVNYEKLKTWKLWFNVKAIEYDYRCVQYKCLRQIPKQYLIRIQLQLAVLCK